jgi:diguanylate cyclase (GGDEF)-like protein/PAS domain S-box-containing protein
VNALRWLRIGPIGRLSLGLVALLVSLLLLADMLLGVVPGRGETERRVRQRVAENLALQITPLLEAGDTTTLGKTIQQVLARDAGILAIAVRRTDGSLMLGRGPASPAAGEARGTASTLDRLRVPIFSGREPWGEIDIRFAPAAPSTLFGWLAQPGLRLLLVVGIGGFLLCYAYLRRAMHYLNPSASVPERVRKAFDSLAEGLVIIDQQARIVLANRAFRELNPRADDELNGKRIDAIEWLADGRAEPNDTAAPWAPTLQTGEPVQARPFELQLPSGSAMQLLVSSVAITDNKGRARGCLITFDDVTAVHQANEELRHTLQQLESSRQRIEEQNGELRRLASRDSLTGCYNRRAFFEQAVELFAQANGAKTPLCCLMVDIDHFKQFNDVYGHAVGDQVIQVVSRALSAGLRQGDVLGRYGGEEFSIVLPGTTPQEAQAVAERMRSDIEANARTGVRGTDVMPITASFGVAVLSFAVQNIETLIDQADQALYQSKQGGRNRVTLWQRASKPTKAPAAAPAAQAALGAH